MPFGMTRSTSKRFPRDIETTDQFSTRPDQLRINSQDNLGFGPKSRRRRPLQPAGYLPHAQVLPPQHRAIRSRSSSDRYRLDRDCSVTMRAAARRAAIASSSRSSERCRAAGTPHRFRPRRRSTPSTHPQGQVAAYVQVCPCPRTLLPGALRQILEPKGPHRSATNDPARHREDERPAVPAYPLKEQFPDGVRREGQPGRVLLAGWIAWAGAAGSPSSSNSPRPSPSFCR